MTRVLIIGAASLVSKIGHALLNAHGKDDIELYPKVAYFDGEGGGDGGGGEDVAAQLAAAQDKITALQTSLDKVTNNRDSALDDLKSLKKKWGDLDPEKVTTMMERFENDEDLKLIAEGKHDEVIAKRVDKFKTQYEERATAAETELNKYKEDNAKLTSQVSDLQIDINVVSAFVREGGAETAIDDIKTRAKGVFQYKDGSLVPLDSDGDVIPGAKGEPMTPTEWVNSIKESAPHLFGTTSSSGSKGNRSGAKLNIDVKIEQARQSGDIETLRTLKKAKKEGKTDV